MLKHELKAFILEKSVKYVLIFYLFFLKFLDATFPIQIVTYLLFERLFAR